MSNESNQNGKLDILIAIALSVVFFVLNGFTLNFKGPWIDELLTYSSIVRPIKGLVIDRLHAGHSPVYFLMLKGWAELLGSYDLGYLRLFSLIFASAFYSSSYYILRQFAISRQSIVLIMLILLVSPFMSFVAQTSRMYSLLIFLSLWNIYYYSKFVSSWQKKDLILSALFLLGAYLVHASAVFVFIAECGLLVISHYRRISGILKYAVVVMLALIAGVVYVYILQGGHAVAIPSSFSVPKDYLKIALAPGMLLAGISDLYCFRSGSSTELLWVKIAGWVISCTWLIALYWTRPFANSETDRGERQLKQISFYLVVAIYFLLFVVGFFGYPRTISLRYYSLMYWPLILLYSIGCSNLFSQRYGKKKLLSVLSLGLVIAIVGANAISAYFYHRYYGPGMREAVNFLNDNDLTKGRVIYPHGSGFGKALEYYHLPKGAFLGVAHSRSKTEEVVGKIKNYLSNADKFVLITHAIPGQEAGFLSLRKAIEQAFEYSYRPVAELTFNQTKIIVYDKNFRIFLPKSPKDIGLLK